MKEEVRYPRREGWSAVPSRDMMAGAGLKGKPLRCAAIDKCIIICSDDELPYTAARRFIDEILKGKK